MPSVDSLPFFYQRTIYLENLNQQGAWWSNPAVLSSTDQAAVFASNSGLLGGKYILSSVRMLFPIKSRINGGIGLTGTGTSESRSGSLSSSGAQVNSNFSFKRPSLEFGVSYISTMYGAIGGLGIIGTESIPRISDTGYITFFFYGMSMGWLSPALFNIVKLSFSTLSICHIQDTAWWDNSAKAGLLFDFKDGFVLGSIEYGFSFSNPLSIFYDQTHFHGYEVIKGDFSIRFRKIAGALIGFSVDTKNFRDNRSTFHTGIELRRSSIYQFSGGYEIGMNVFASRFHSTSPHLALIHRFCIGYDLKSK
jgi:hypothetical protein